MYQKGLQTLTLGLTKKRLTRIPCQYHKLNTEPAIKEAVDDPGREHAIVDNIVVSTVAMKSVMA
jgi:hypothetical protein